MKTMLHKVNKDLVPIKAHYFLYNAGTAPVVPFLSTYARQLGLSSAIVGLIYTLLPIFGMVTKPTVGLIADRFKCQKTIFLIGQIVTAGAFLAILFSPDIPYSLDGQAVHFSCNDGETVFDTSPNNGSINTCSIDAIIGTSGTIPCQMDCKMDPEFWPIVINSWGVSIYNLTNHPDNLQFVANVDAAKTLIISPHAYFKIKDVTIEGATYTPICKNGNVDRISMLCRMKTDNSLINQIYEDPIDDADTYKMYQYWVFLILMIIGWMGQAIVVSIGDAICFEMLGDKPNRYGYQRMFGALGWGIFSIFAGLIVDAMSRDSCKKNFAGAFYMACGILLIDFIVSYQLKHAQVHVSSNIFRDVGKLLMNVRIIVFLAWCICVGMCTGLIWQFLFYLVEDLAKADGGGGSAWIKTLEGIIMAVQTLAGEMPFFFWSGKILKRIGHTNAMSLVLLTIGIRYILYSFIPNPWWFLPVELMNGLTFGLFYACMASYASIIAPPGTEATMQGMVGAIFEGVGVSLGSYIGGQLYDVHGGPMTFKIFGIGALVACVVHFGIQFLLGKSDIEAHYAAPLDALKFDDDDQQELTLMS